MTVTGLNTLVVYIGDIIGIMVNEMETTIVIVNRVYIGIIIGIMVNEMETTIVIGYILGL